MEPTEDQWRAYVEHLNGMPSGSLRQEGESHRIQAKGEYEEFLYHMGRGECYICKKKLNTFSVNFPCIHWMLRAANGVKKQHIERILKIDGYHRSAAYLRWFANYQDLHRNINNLSEEGDQKAVFHWTCCYKDVKWTFKCSTGDRGGHEGSKHDYPHFHVEMRIRDQIFVKFNDFHIPFTDEDLFWLRANDDPNSPIKQSFAPHGAGMEEALSLPPGFILDNVEQGREGEEDRAVFQIDSIIFREEGIPGDLVEKAFRASQISGKTMAWHLREVGLDPSIILSPAKTIPDKSQRNNPRKKKC